MHLIFQAKPIFDPCYTDCLHEEDFPACYRSRCLQRHTASRRGTQDKKDASVLLTEREPLVGREQHKVIKLYLGKKEEEEEEEKKMQQRQEEAVFHLGDDYNPCATCAPFDPYFYMRCLIDHGCF